MYLCHGSRGQSQRREVALIAWILCLRLSSRGSPKDRGMPVASRHGTVLCVGQMHASVPWAPEPRCRGPRTAGRWEGLMTRHGGGRGGHQPNRPRLYLTVTVVLRRCSTSSPMHCIFTLKKKRAHTLRFRLPQSYAMPETIALRASAGQQDSDLPPSRRGVCVT